MGFSPSRLAMIALMVLVILVLIIALINFRKLSQYLIRKLITKDVLPTTNWMLILFAIFLALTILYPPSSFGKLSSYYIRLQPLLVFGSLLGFQFAILVKILLDAFDINMLHINRQPKPKKLLLGLAIMLFVALLFILLRDYSPEIVGRQLYIAPGVPLSSLQVFISLLVFSGLLVIERRKGKVFFDKKIVNVTTFVFIWVVTILIWSSTVLPCTDDLVGGSPPNYICYPQINDAVYSIGSHYITLGQGIYNHWLTDKPLYMAFLALGQLIAGPAINEYLFFQVAVLAVIPSLLFVIGRRSMGFSGGILLSYFSILLGALDISLYSSVESVSVKNESPEYLTILLMILLGIFLFRWFQNPQKHQWAILSGGILGLSSLVRFTPLTILVIVLPLFMLIQRKMIKKAFIGGFIFLVAFVLAFFPWFFSATDVNGQNFYLIKIQDVISQRFTGKSVPVDIKDEIGPVSSLTKSAISESSESPPTPLSEPRPTPSSSSYPLYYLDQSIDSGGGSGVFYHFVNNFYSSLVRLPINFSFLTTKDVVKQDVWNANVKQPTWKRDLSTENLITSGFSLSLVLLGLFFAVKKFGWAGLTGLVIQTGYFLGAAAAQTSGGRYLVPVFWVTLLYYCMGLFQIVTWIFAFMRIPTFLHVEPEQGSPALGENSQRQKDSRRKKNIAWLGMFLILGWVLPLLNNLPSKMMADLSEQELADQTYSYLSRVTSVSESQWQSFLEDPNSVIVQGVAYHPRNYRSIFFDIGSLSYEMMVLAKNEVVVSYLRNVEPKEYFTDGSQVIIIGCKIGEDSLWAAVRIIVNSIGVIQLNNEENIFLSSSGPWSCK
jgi:hypothetical protein